MWVISRQHEALTYSARLQPLLSPASVLYLPLFFSISLSIFDDPRRLARVLCVDVILCDLDVGEVPGSGIGENITV